MSVILDERETEMATQKRKYEASFKKGHDISCPLVSQSHDHVILHPYHRCVSFTPAYA